MTGSASGEVTTALVLGALFLVGLAADILGRHTVLPRVTLLLLSGLAVGPAGFGLLPPAFIEQWFPPLTAIALALIGFLLGQRISVTELRAHGRNIVTLTTAKVLGAWLMVGAVLVLIGTDPVVALLLAGIAPATAPTATYDLVHESGQDNEFTRTLLSVVALDDVWCLLVFILMLAVAGVVTGGTAIGTGIVLGFGEIGGSIVLGIVLGMPMALLTGRIRPGEPTLAEALGFVLLGAGMAEWLELTPRLTAMAMGSTVATLATHHERPFHAIEGIEWPFMILFFLLAGASVETAAAAAAGALTAVYILARVVGTWAGTAAGAAAIGASLPIRRWLGFALYPQAGVAIGLALLASQRFPQSAAQVLPVVLASTVVFEIVAPVVTRQVLKKASVDARPAEHSE